MKKLLQNLKEKSKKLKNTINEYKGLIICIVFIFCFCVFIVIRSYQTIKQQEINKQQFVYNETLDVNVYSVIPLTAIEYGIPNNFYIEKKEINNKIYFKVYFLINGFIHSLIIDNENIAISYKLKQDQSPYIVIIGKRKNLKKRNFKNMKFVVYVPYKTIWSIEIKKLFYK